MTPPVLSASQYETFALCELKGFFTYVLKFREPGTAATYVGTRVHTHLERYLLNGTLPDVTDLYTYFDKRGKSITRFPGQLANAAIPLLPPPGVTIVEGGFKMQTAAAHWRGARDGVTGLDAQGRYFYPVKGIQPKLLDHKTTSNPTYALDTEGLSDDVQGSLYAWELMESYQVDTVPGQWNYILTDPKPYAPNKSTHWWTQEAQDKWDLWVKAKKPAAWKSEHVYTFAQTKEKILEIDEGARRILKLYEEKPEVTKVRHDLSGCDAYGGCPHQARCHIYQSSNSLTPSGSGGTFWDRLSSLDSLPDEKGSEEMTTKLSDILAAKKAEQNALAGLPPPPPPAPETKPWSPGDPLNQHQQLKLSTGASLLAVAMAADNPPDEDDVLSWPNRKQRYADVIADLEAAVALEVEALAKIKAESLPPPPPPEPQGTPIGVPERGYINSPEAPPVAFRNPEELLAYQSPPAPSAPEETRGVTHSWVPFTDRDLAKKEAVRLGLVDEGCSFRLPRLNEILQEYALKGMTPAMSASAEKAAQEIGQAIPPPPKAPSFAPGAIAARVPASGFTLYLSCFPVKGADAVPFSSIAAKASARVREGTGLAHPSLADFGKGQAMFAVEVEKELTGFSGALYADLRSRETQDALGALERLAAVIVRGL